jgi:hypothetical protein
VWLALLVPLVLRRQLDASFLTRLRPIVAAVATERGVLLVLDEDAGGIVRGTGMLHLTADVITRINRLRERIDQLTDTGELMKLLVV